MLRSATFDGVITILEASNAFVFDLVLDAGVDWDYVCTGFPFVSVGIFTGEPVCINFLGNVRGVSVVGGPSQTNFSMNW